MADLIRAIVREPGAKSVPSYRKRVHRLSAVYVVMFVSSLAGVFLLLWRSRFLVNLAQRTNVETLVLGFFLVFFAYVGSLSAAGAFGALRVLWYAARGRRDRVAGERRKQAALAKKEADNPSAAMNLMVVREDAPGEPFDLTIADRAGRLGRIRVDGARIGVEAEHRAGSNNLLNFFVEQVNELKGGDQLEVVEWMMIDDEETQKYLAHVEFARNLERALDKPMWPRVVLSQQNCNELERRLSQLCPALRDECFLPDWEFRGEHKLPIVPEPLGLISLQRSERRVDPEASMIAAAVVVLAAVALLVYLILVPPWTPAP